MTKITNITALQNAIATLSAIEGYDAEVITKLTNIKASYEKKASAERKPTKVQIENEGIKARISDLMTEGTAYTVSDICKALDNEFSNQKISALMNAMAEDNILTKATENRKTVFTLA